MSPLNLALSDFPLIVNVKPDSLVAQRTSLMIFPDLDEIPYKGGFKTTVFHFDFAEQSDEADDAVSCGSVDSYFDFWKQKAELGISDVRDLLR